MKLRPYSAFAELLLDVRHQGYVTSSLDRDSKRSLMLRAVPGDPSRKNLASLRDILSQLCDVLVIDLTRLFSTEDADFLSSVHRSAARGIASFLRKRHDPYLLKSTARGRADPSAAPPFYLIIHSERAGTLSQSSPRRL